MQIAGFPDRDRDGFPHGKHLRSTAHKQEQDKDNSYKE
jgi:hypothetical protein